MTDTVEKYYMNRAIEFIDALFDKGYFSSEVTRKDLRGLDELLGYMFQAEIDSELKARRFTREIRKMDVKGTTYIDSNTEKKQEFE